MHERPVNFSAGPAILPQEVLEQASRDVLALEGVGLSILEISHRSPPFEAVLEEARERITRLLNVPESHDVLFLQGGARAQFAQVPMNFLREGQHAAYVDTGVWSAGAVAEAKRVGEASVVASGEASGYSALPEIATDGLDERTAYVHTTSNNTIYGTQWQTLPDVGAHRHVCDMSSDIFSRPIDVGAYGLIYAGAQKNAGPAGVTLVIAEKSWMAEAREDIPVIWRYETQAKKGSTYNTPPVFAIYVVGLVARWLEEQGGVAAAVSRNEAKAGLLYETMARSQGMYTPTVANPAHRSRMNVTWRIADRELEPIFVAEAAKQGLSGLKGHRLVGGIRASIYNAMTLEGCERLAAFMDDFASRHASS